MAPKRKKGVKATGKSSIAGHFGAAAAAEQEGATTAVQDRAAEATESQRKKARTEPKEGAGAIAIRKSPRKEAAAAAAGAAAAADVDMTDEADVDMTAVATTAAAAGGPATVRVTAMQTLIKQAVAAAKAGATGAAKRAPWAVFFEDAQLAALVDQPEDPTLAILSMSSTNGNCFYRVCALASGQPMTKIKEAIKKAGTEALRVGTDATLIDCVRQIILGTQPPDGAMEELKKESSEAVIAKFTAAVDKAEKTAAFYAGSNEAALLAHHADFKHIQLLSFKWPAAASAQFTMYGARSRGVQTTAVLLAHMDRHYGLLMERGENGVVNWKFNEEQLGHVAKKIGIAVPERLVGDKVDLSQEGQQSSVAAAAAAADAAGPPKSPSSDAEEVGAAEEGGAEQQDAQRADEKSADEDAATAAAVPPNGDAAAAAAPGESALVVAAAGPAEPPPAHKKLVFHNTVSDGNVDVWTPAALADGFTVQKYDERPAAPFTLVVDRDIEKATLQAVLDELGDQDVHLVSSVVFNDVEAADFTLTAALKNFRQALRNVAVQLAELEAGEREDFISKLIVALGGQRCRDPGEPTHLVTSRALHAQYGSAAKRGIPCVKPDWVLQCFRIGQRAVDPAVTVRCMAGAHVFAFGLDQQAQHASAFIANAGGTCTTGGGDAQAEGEGEADAQAAVAAGDGAVNIPPETTHIIVNEGAARDSLPKWLLDEADSRDVPFVHADWLKSLNKSEGADWEWGKHALVDAHVAGHVLPKNILERMHGYHVVANLPFPDLNAHQAWIKAAQLGGKVDQANPVLLVAPNDYLQLMSRSPAAIGHSILKVPFTKAQSFLGTMHHAVSVSRTYEDMLRSIIAARIIIGEVLAKSTPLTMEDVTAVLGNVEKRNRAMDVMIEYWSKINKDNPRVKGKTFDKPRAKFSFFAFQLSLLDPDQFAQTLPLLRCRDTHLHRLCVAVQTLEWLPARRLIRFMLQEINCLKDNGAITTNAMQDFTALFKGSQAVQALVNSHVAPAGDQEYPAHLMKKVEDEFPSHVVRADVIQRNKKAHPTISNWDALSPEMQKTINDAHGKKGPDLVAVMRQLRDVKSLLKDKPGGEKDEKEEEKKEEGKNEKKKESKAAAAASPPKSAILVPHKQAKIQELLNQKSFAAVATSATKRITRFQADGGQVRVDEEDAVPEADALSNAVISVPFQLQPGADEDPASRRDRLARQSHLMKQLRSVLHRAPLGLPRHYDLECWHAVAEMPSIFQLQCREMIFGQDAATALHMQKEAGASQLFRVDAALQSIEVAQQLVHAVAFLHHRRLAHRQISLQHIVLVNALGIAVQVDPPLSQLRCNFDITSLLEPDFALTEPASAAAEVALAALDTSVADAETGNAVFAAAPPAADTPLSPPIGTRVVLTDLAAMVDSRADLAAAAAKQVQAPDLPDWCKSDRWFEAANYPLFGDVLDEPRTSFGVPPSPIESDLFCLCLSVIQLLMGVSFADKEGALTAGGQSLIQAFQVWVVQKFTAVQLAKNTALAPAAAPAAGALSTDEKMAQLSGGLALGSALSLRPSIVEFLEEHKEGDEELRVGITRFRTAIRLLGPERTEQLRQGTSLPVAARSSPSASDLLFDLVQAIAVKGKELDEKLVPAGLKKLHMERSDGDSFGLALMAAISKHPQIDAIKKAHGDSKLVTATKATIQRRINHVRFEVWRAWKADVAPLDVTGAHIDDLFLRGFCHPRLFNAIPTMLMTQLASLRVRIFSVGDVVTLPDGAAAAAADGAAARPHLVNLLFHQGRYHPLMSEAVDVQDEGEKEDEGDGGEDEEYAGKERSSNKKRGKKRKLADPALQSEAEEEEEKEQAAEAEDKAEGEGQGEDASSAMELV